MHRSRLDMRGSDAGAGGMSISSGSGGASGIGASSSSDASAMAQSTGSSGAGSSSMCLAHHGVERHGLCNEGLLVMSAQSVTRIAGSGTTVYQCCTYSQSVQDCASLVSSSRTRTGRRQGRHPTPGSPALWTRAKQKRNFGQKGRLTKEKKREGTFYYRNIPARIFLQF